MATVRLQSRRDTLANWTTENPILGSGEHGFETDTGYERIGDGSTAFLALGQRQQYFHYDDYAAFAASTEGSRGIGVIWRYGPFSGEEVASGDISNSAGTPVELDVLPNADGGSTVEAFGGGSGEADNSSFVEAALAAFGRITFRTGESYTFTSQVEINADAVIDFNGATVSFGLGGGNLFSVLTAVSRVEIRNCAGTTILGLAGGADCTKNFVTNFDDTPAVGFPVGTSYPIDTFIFENNDHSATRVIVDSNEGIVRIEDNIAVDSTYVVRPSSYQVLDFRLCTVSSNRMKAEYHEDSAKFMGPSSGNLKFTDNYVEQTGLANVGEVDIYAGLDKAVISGNTFINSQVHRKQDGGDGSPSSGGFDIISENMFTFGGAITFTASMILFRGSRGRILGNAFNFIDTGAGSTWLRAVEINEEISEHETGTSKSGFISITGNICDAIDTSGPDTQFIHRDNSGTEGRSVPVNVVGNNVRGCHRFVNGVVDIYTGNSWTDELGSSFGDGGAFVSTGNLFPDGYSPLGSTSQNRSSTANTDTASNQQIDVSKTDVIRKTGGGSLDDLINGKLGQVVTIYNRVTTFTILHNTAKISLAGGVNFAMGTRHSLTLMKISSADGTWQEIGRSA